MDLRELSDLFFVLLEVVPVCFVYVPAAKAMDHVRVLRIVCFLNFLLVYYIFGQVDLVEVQIFVKVDMDLGSWNEGRFGLHVAIFRDFILINLGLLVCPFLIFIRGEKDVTFFKESERN